jgi:hypothetical protein
MQRMHMQIGDGHLSQTDHHHILCVTNQSSLLTVYEFLARRIQTELQGDTNPLPNRMSIKRTDVRVIRPPA